MGADAVVEEHLGLYIKYVMFGIIVVWESMV
jgi:hypothetical protein